MSIHMADLRRVLESRAIATPVGMGCCGLGFATLAEHGAVCATGKRIEKTAAGDEVCVGTEAPLGLVVVDGPPVIEQLIRSPHFPHAHRHTPRRHGHGLGKLDVALMERLDDRGRTSAYRSALSSARAAYSNIDPVTGDDALDAAFELWNRYPYVQGQDPGLEGLRQATQIKLDAVGLAREDSRVPWFSYVSDLRSGTTFTETQGLTETTLQSYRETEKAAPEFYKRALDRPDPTEAFFRAIPGEVAARGRELGHDIVTFPKLFPAKEVGTGAAIGAGIGALGGGLLAGTNGVIGGTVGGAILGALLGYASSSTEAKP